MNHSQDKTSMQAHSWIMVWKFVMGIGIGRCLGKPSHSFVTNSPRR
jgi:hypothetical protein